MAEIKETTFPELAPPLQSQPDTSPILPREQISGSSLGTAEVRIQGRYLVNDGTNDRVLLGRF